MNQYNLEQLAFQIWSRSSQIQCQNVGQSYTSQNTINSLDPQNFFERTIYQDLFPIEMKLFANHNNNKQHITKNIQEQQMLSSDQSNKWQENHTNGKSNIETSSLNNQKYTDNFSELDNSQQFYNLGISSKSDNLNNRSGNETSTTQFDNQFQTLNIKNEDQQFCFKDIFKRKLQQYLEQPINKVDLKKRFEKYKFKIKNK